MVPWFTALHILVLTFVTYFSDDMSGILSCTHGMVLIPHTQGGRSLLLDTGLKSLQIHQYIERIEIFGELPQLGVLGAQPHKNTIHQDRGSTSQGAAKNKGWGCGGLSLEKSPAGARGRPRTMTQIK